MQALWRSNAEITQLYHRHCKTVIRVCMLYFRGNQADAEDAVQTTFLKLMKDRTRFRSEEHEKAWLIVTAGNVCKDMLSSAWRRHVTTDETVLDRQTVQSRDDRTLQSVLELPDSCKTAVYLFYYEGYSVKEIASYMAKTESSIEKYLRKGRDLLRQSLREDR